MIQRYAGCYTQQIEEFLDEERNDENEDYDLCQNQESVITIIRIPMVYYRINMDDSFYALCCRFAHFFNTTRDFMYHPLLNVIGKNIANFDCFQSSVPKVWNGEGSIYEMFTKYGLGVYDHADIEDFALNAVEFTKFVGAYDCFKQIEFKKKCRKQVLRCWTNVLKDLNIMSIVIEYSGLTQMSDDQIVTHIDSFDPKSEKYKFYLNELKRRINTLEDIVDFESSL